MSRSLPKPKTVIVVDDTPPPSPQPATTSGSSQRSVVAYVSLPEFSAERKARYKSFKDSTLFPKIDEIIGEYVQGSRLWYFARFQGGIAYRVRRCLVCASFGYINAFYFVQYPGEGFETYFSGLLETYSTRL